MKWLALVCSLVLAQFANAQTTPNFPAIPFRPNQGVQPVLQQLSEMHGKYQIEGTMRDGTKCSVRVTTSPSEFRITIYDNRPNQALEELVITPATRALAFELRDNPDKRTLLSLRDRVTYPAGSGRRDVDLTVYIEEANDSHKVWVRYEDRVKRRNYFCSGYKTKM
ncbi:MAG: hypothetical protein KF767_10340 [Bdellovibrionaceae bacterium]|nr:hypothetical protein [Pseudobdellovibrionaceae bacterium]